MKEFFLKHWKWMVLLGFIALGMYLSAWYYFNVIKKKETKSGET